MSLRARHRRRRRRGARRGVRARRRWRPSVCGGVRLVAPVAVRVRRSPALSLRISPTVMARIASARSGACGGRDRDGRRMRVRSPLHLDRRGRRSAASWRAAAICSLVRGLLDSMSQPLGTRCQPWRRRPSRVTKRGRQDRCRLPQRRETSRLSILWTFVTGAPCPVPEVQDDELVGGHGSVGQEVRAGIDRGGIDAEVPEQGEAWRRRGPIREVEAPGDPSSS